MVETVLDPIRMPTITLTEAELSDIEGMIERGALPGDFLDRYYDAVDKNVFGHDHKKNRHGQPIEQGMGSAANQTQNSINAYKRYGKFEDGYTPERAAEVLKRMEAELAECNARREAEAPRRRGRPRK